MINWASLAKIELHLHLEGGAPPDFIRALAQEKKVELEPIFDEKGEYRYNDFLDFLRVYEAATSVLQTPEDFGRLTFAVLEQSAKHGVIYTEIFVSPDFCGKGDVGAWRDYFSHICQAAQKAEDKFGIVARFIVTAVRHFGAENAKQAARCAIDQAGKWLVGFGMGGDENFGHPKDFVSAFAMANEAGLGLTTHAGEWGGADSIKESLDHLNVTRIGHGVRAIESANLVAELAEKQIVLEVNPGSNIALGLYKNLNDHPLRELMREKVPVTISTDDPPYFHTNMTLEFENLERTIAWTQSDFNQVNLTAIQAAFCDEATKMRISSRFMG